MQEAKTLSIPFNCHRAWRNDTRTSDLDTRVETIRIRTVCFFSEKNHRLHLCAVSLAGQMAGISSKWRGREDGLVPSSQIFASLYIGGKSPKLDTCRPAGTVPFELREHLRPR